MSTEWDHTYFGFELCILLKVRNSMILILAWWSPRDHDAIFRRGLHMVELSCPTDQEDAPRVRLSYQ